MKKNDLLNGKKASLLLMCFAATLSVFGCEKKSTVETASVSIETESLETSADITYEYSSDLVTDAYWDTLYDGYFSQKILCYHIPQINKDGASISDINTKIYNQLDDILQKDVYTGMESENYFPQLSGMAYSWKQNENLLSIIVETNQNGWVWTDYDVYNIFIDTGNEASIEEVAAMYDLSEEQYFDLAKTTLEKYLELLRNSLNASVNDTVFNDIVEHTLADENVRASIPYINANGDLCIVANVYSLAGADSYFHLLNTSDGTEEAHITCTIDHSNEIAETAEQTTESYETEAMSGEVQTLITQEELLGEWSLDTEYTMNYNNMSMTDLYGTSFSDSNPKMVFNDDGSFTYYAAWCYGNGNYSLNSETIRLDLYDGDPVQGTTELQVYSDGVKRIGLDQFNNGTIIFWTHK